MTNSVVSKTENVIALTHNLTVGYPAVGKGKANAILKGLNLSLPEATLTLLIGANGSGKSTLLRSIAGTQHLLGGTVEIAGKSIDRLSLRQRARLLALVYTDRTGGGGLTVRELVGLGRQPYTGFIGRLSSDDREAVDTALDAVGIAHKADSYMASLSDGERQKAMIARALAQETPLIVLDEPTSFLDIASRLEIMQLLARLVSDEHKTVLLSTHDLSSSLGVADRLWIVDSAMHSVIEGCPERLIADGAMERVFPDRTVTFNTDSNDFIIKSQL